DRGSSRMPPSLWGNLVAAEKKAILRIPLVARAPFSKNGLDRQRNSSSEATSRSNGSSAERRRRYGETVTRWTSPHTHGTSIGRRSLAGSVSTLRRRSSPADLQPNEITHP